MARVSSLRRKLSARFALTMGVTLLTIALWAYLGIRRILVSQLDQALHPTWHHQALALARGGRLLAAPAGTDQDRFIRQFNRMVVARDSGGGIVQSNIPLASTVEPDSASHRQALEGALVVGSGRWQGQEIRSLYGPAPASAAPAAVLQVAASLAPLERSSRDVLFRMVATALLGSLASLVGAGWLAKAALAPVEQIAEQARAIQGEAAGQRISAHADVVELRGLIEVLNAMLARLERSHEWQRRIIRDVGHDLRTPLTTMKGSVEMALRSGRTLEEYQRVLAGLEEEIDRLAMIGDAMSLLGQMESGQLAPVLTMTDIRQVVSRAVDHAGPRARHPSVRLDVPPAPVPCLVDARLLHIALDQLLDNVRRHTPPGTRVDVAVGMEDGRVFLTVEDHGPGVPDEMLPELFSRFYRGDAARGRQAGAGLGLTLAAAVVDLHGGRITAARGAGGGLRVVIELPVETAASCRS